MRKLTVLSIFIALVFCMSFATSAVASDEDDVLRVAINFAKAMNDADLELMSSIYWHSPQLSGFGPSVSGAFLTRGWEAEESSWKGFLGMPKGTFVNTIHNPLVTMLKDDVAIVTLYCNLVVNPPATEEQINEHMRTTIVVQKIGGKWLIVHGHTSRLPVN